MPTQDELDAWFSVTPEERRLLATGMLPDRLKRAQGALGCLSFGAAIFGAGAGAIFGWNVFGVVGGATGLDQRTFVGACAAVGAVLAFVIFRHRFGSPAEVAGRIAVRSTVAEVRPEGSLLVALDGRRFRCLRPPPAELQGRFRIFYADVDPNAPVDPEDTRRFNVVAVERVD